MIVIGAVWVIIYNADLLLGAVMAIFGRVKALAPLLRMSMAYPLRSRFRTGTTLAMFTLVVFTLVTGSTSTESFQAALNDVDAFGGGFDIRAGTGARAPIPDMRAQLDTRPGSERPTIRRRREPVRPRRRGASARYGRPFEDVPRPRARQLVPRAHDLPARRHRARLHELGRDVWTALQEHVGLAVVDSLVVQRRDQFGFNAMPSDFKVTGFYADDGKPFDPVSVEILDKQSGERTKLTIIGVLADSAPFEMVASRPRSRRSRRRSPGVRLPRSTTSPSLPGVDAGAAADRLEGAFLSNGLEAESIQKVRRRLGRGEPDLHWLIQGFMAPRARRRRRSARRDQRPRRRRAAPADRRDAGDRVQADDVQAVFCSSPLSSR